MKNILRYVINIIPSHKLQNMAIIFLTMIISAFTIGATMSLVKVKYINEQYQASTTQYDFTLDCNQTNFYTQPGSYLKTRANIDSFLTTLNQYLHKNAHSDKTDETFNYSIRDMRTFTGNNGKWLFLVMEANINNWVEQLHLLSGRLPSNPNEIMLSPFFARANQIALGSKLVINNEAFSVVGYATTPDMLFPQFNKLNVLPDQRSQAVVFSYSGDHYLDPKNPNYPSAFEDSKFIPTSQQNTELVVLGHFADKRPGINIENRLNILTMAMNTARSPGQGGQLGPLLSTVFNSGKADGSLYARADDNYVYNSRVTNFLVLFNDFIYIIISIVTIVALVTTYLIITLTSKRILYDRNRIATLTALGFAKNRTLFLYLIPPFIMAVIGLIFGFIGGLFLQYSLNDFLFNFFMLPQINDVNYLMSFVGGEWSYLGVAIGMVILIILIVSFISFISVSRSKVIAQAIKER